MLIKPVEFDPTQLVGWCRWSDDSGDTDQRSLALTEVDFSKVIFETCLKENETSITSAEKLRRLIAGGNIRLDPRFGMALFQERGQKTLGRLREEHGMEHVDFFGRIMVGFSITRCVFSLSHLMLAEWMTNFHCLDDRREPIGECTSEHLSACLPSPSVLSSSIT